MRRIYFDHGVTTPVHPLVAEEMYRCLQDNFGNPSSLHHFGNRARKAVEEAREKVAAAIGANPPEIVFTSGGTEANNMAIHGIAYTNQHRGNHIITTAVEHHSVINTVKALGKQGFTVTILPVDSYGMVRPEDVARAITDRTILISIIHANNEIGTVNPVAEIGRIAREKGVYFHTDACQSFGRLRVNVEELNVDLLTISGHKIHGPKGVGALYLRKGVRWRQTLFHGGAQERLRRAGTENVPGIVGLGKAAELAASDLEARAAQLARVRDYAIKRILGSFKHVRLTGHPTARLPNHASFCFDFVEGESMLLSLDLKGIATSSGSACTSGSLEPSHVLLAIGLPPEVAHGSLCLTFGPENTEADVDYFVEVMGPILERLRAISPLDEETAYADRNECLSCRAADICRHH
jgi:cysteine desulfurase